MHFKRFINVLALLIIIVGLIANYKSILKIFYPAKYSDYIVKYSNEYNLDPYFVTAVIKAESNFNVNAKSNKNAYGLMQITPDTAMWVASKMKMKNFTEQSLYNPDINIRMGCWYLNDLKTEFDGNLELVLAAYNGGRGNVEKWLKSSGHSEDGKNLKYIPFPETDKYIKKVKVNYNIYKFLYGK